MVDKVERITPALHEGGRFLEWSSVDLAAQCLAQAREQLDPEFSQFMTAVAARLAATPTQDTRDRVKVLEGALERLSKPYFWTEDGFWADASTPAHRETELHQRLQIARTALGNKETDRG